MILLLGNGILGSEVVRCFQLNNVKFYQANRNSIDVTSPYFDLRNQIDALQYQVHDRFTHVINAAGFTKVDAAEKNKDAALAINSYGANKLAQVCNYFKSTLVHISTDFVFDGTQSPTNPYIEEDQTNPVNFYGYTKFLAEQMIKESGCKYLIIRSGKLYNQEKGFIFSILNKMKNEKRIYGVRNQTFTPTNAFNLAFQILDLIRYDVSGIYHITNSGYTTALNLVEFMKKVLDSSIQVDPINLYEQFSEARRPEMTVLSLRKITSLGLFNMPDWAGSLEYTLKSIRGVG